MRRPALVRCIYCRHDVPVKDGVIQGHKIGGVRCKGSGGIPQSFVRVGAFEYGWSQATPRDEFEDPDDEICEASGETEGGGTVPGVREEAGAELRSLRDVPSQEERVGARPLPSPAGTGSADSDVPGGPADCELVTSDDSGSVVRRYYERLNGIPASELIDRFRVLVHQTVDSLAWMAAIAKRLAELGKLEQLTANVGEPIVFALMEIADGSLHPEVYLRFGGRSGVLRQIRSLPVAEQLRLASSETIDVPGPGGSSIAVRRVPPSELTVSQAARIVRRSDLNRGPKPPLPKVRVDTARRGICVGRVFISSGDLRRYLDEIESVLSADPRVCP